MSTGLIRLRLQAHATLLERDDGSAITLAVGSQGLVDAVLRHDPPNPAELERAIDLIEDALTGAHRALAAGAWLVTADVRLRSLPGLEVPGARLARDAVESLFQRLASRALGTPIPSAELPHGREIAAALLILRECMHHLGFAGIVVGPA